MASQGTDGQTYDVTATGGATAFSTASDAASLRVVQPMLSIRDAASTAAAEATTEKSKPANAPIAAPGSAAGRQRKTKATKPASAAAESV